MRHLSASKMGLARQCLYWARDDVELPIDVTSDAASIGIWYHAVCAWTINGCVGDEPSRPEDIGDANEMTPRDDATRLLEEYPAAKIKAEASYIYSPRGSRYLGCDLGRNYGTLDPDEISGTADVVILIDKNRAVVVDWKSGRPVESAKTNRQLALYALMVAEVHGVREVEVQIRYADGWIDRHTIDEIDLASTKDDVDATINRLLNEPKPNPGLHCTTQWCPLRTVCPSTISSLEPMMPAASLSVYDPVEVASRGVAAIQSAEHAASLWTRAAAAQAMLDAVAKAVKDYVDTHGPIALSADKELALVEETRESIDGTSVEEIYTALQQWAPLDAFRDCVKVSVGKGDLEKLIKSTAPKNQKSAAWQSALESLREAGKIRAKTITRHSIRTIKGDAK